jgi:hypothetical protein
MKIKKTLKMRMKIVKRKKTLRKRKNKMRKTKMKKLVNVKNLNLKMRRILVLMKQISCSASTR